MERIDLTSADWCKNLSKTERIAILYRALKESYDEIDTFVSHMRANLICFECGWPNHNGDNHDIEGTCLRIAE
jgi:hypothetical protein